MSEYMISVFLLSMITGTLEMLVFKGGRGSGERVAFAVLVAFTVLTPVEKLIESFDTDSYLDIPEYGEEGEAQYEIAVREAVEASLEKAISDEFSVKVESVKVRVADLSLETMKAEKVIITLSLGAGRIDPLRLKKYVTDILGGVCEVSYEIG